METISYLNLKVEGVNFTKILELNITHAINQHGVATVVGEMPLADARNAFARADEKAAIKITTTAAGQPSVLFYGSLDNLALEEMAEYAKVTIVAKTTSNLLDIEGVSRSYQCKSDTYEKVMTKALNGKGIIKMNVTDKATGQAIVQSNETRWKFCVRMASLLGAPIFADIDAQKPTLNIGFPSRGKVVDMSTQQSKAKRESTSAGVGTSISSTQYMYIGSDITYAGVKQKVKAISASMDKGVLYTSVSVASEEKFTQQPISNSNVAGKMYTGEVKGVRADTVQVHIKELDAEYDSSGDVWLPYSTAYSSADGSGFYSMPAEGDTVRVFFPGGNEGDAFVASSVSSSTGAKTTDKQWRGPNGRQILLSEEGIFITSNADDSKIFINLTDTEGITITSDKDITVLAKKNLTLSSNDSIVMAAKQDILISTATSYIDIKKDGIELGAENVVIK